MNVIQGIQDQCRPINRATRFVAEIGFLLEREKATSEEVFLVGAILVHASGVYP